MTPLLTVASPNPGYSRLTSTRRGTLIIADLYGCVRGKKVFPIRDGLIHYRKWMRQNRKFRITSFPTEPCSTIRDWKWKQTMATDRIRRNSKSA
ncbi:hypothetical protein DPMN_097257 [Dreissena polymorpha]|uniref:Uncharacterized protein n=1 Tax=Dreissena polymorpha TaxID=45954 RepID=A0A9D4LA95_DREPO|nr:hypothetical protein DPMN_097257 [Dreissena polymorpha]